MSMNEDAMFKALLKNKPQQQKTPQTQVVKEVKPAAPPAKPSYAKNSEDAMFQVLLKNKPQQQQKSPVRSEAPPAPVIAYEKEEPVVETRIDPVVTAAVNPVQNTYSSGSIDKLTSSVNMVYGLLRTITFILILMLLVGIAVLIKVKV